MTETEEEWMELQANGVCGLTGNEDAKSPKSYTGKGTNEGAPGVSGLYFLLVLLIDSDSLRYVNGCCAISLKKK